MHFFLGELSIKDVESGIVAAKYRKEGAGTFTANLPWVLLVSLLVALLAVLFSPQANTSFFAVVFICLAMAGVAGKALVQKNELFVDFPLSYMKTRRARLS